MARWPRGTASNHGAPLLLGFNIFLKHLLGVLNLEQGYAFLGHTVGLEVHAAAIDRLESRIFAQRRRDLVAMIPIATLGAGPLHALGDDIDAFIVIGGIEIRVGVVPFLITFGERGGPRLVG